MSYNIASKEAHKCGCHCTPITLKPGRLEEAIEQYKKMTAEAEEEKKKFADKIDVIDTFNGKLDDLQDTLDHVRNVQIPTLETEENATSNKEEIIAALPEECSVSDIYAMFNEFGSPFRLDAEGYIVVTNMVYQDDEGYLVLPSPAMDIERYIEVVTI